MKRKITALILALVLLLSQSSVFAVGLDVTENTVSDASEPEILAEDVSKRDEFEKHYIRSDGTYVAVTYDNAVHYKDENGVWQDVDNKVIYNAKSGKYVTSTPTFNAEFRAAGTKDSLVTLKNGESSIAWGLSVVTPNKATMGTVEANDTVTLITGRPAETVTLKNAVSERSDKKYDLTNIVGGIGYTNIFGNAPEISVDYSVSHNRIEEDIYINSPTDATAFKMELYIGELVAAVNSDGSVSIRDSEGNEEYRIGIPYMADANDAVLTNIDVTVTQNDGSCTVTYTPDSSWLTSEDRAYPILFDPSITTSEYAANVYDTYVYQGNTANHSGEQRLYIGVMNSKVYRTYINFGKLPRIDSTMPIISASLTFTMHHTTTTGKTTELCGVTQPWDQSTITYAKQPRYSGPIATSAYNASTNKHIFDITDDITDYYAGINSYPESDGSFHGYLFKYVDETLTNPDYNAPYSSEVSTRAYRPALTVVYGYSLPSGLTTNKEYMFESVGDYTYLTVCGGVDANDVNVCVDYRYYDNNVVSQKFKLVQAANGGYYIRAVCSANNRVLDIYKNDATGYVQNGCNVQIYNPTDPLAQEWFIIGTSQNTYKIIPRTDMTLALTANSGSGTADGRSSTSAGNVYVSTIGGEDQDWYIIDVATDMYVNSDYGYVADGIYYINTRYAGKFFHMTSPFTTVDLVSGTASSLGASICWQITSVGNNLYTIRYANDSQKYLWIDTSTGTLAMGAMSGSNTDTRFLWKLIPATGGGFIIQNEATDLYLYSGTNGVSTHSSLPGPLNPVYECFTYRLVKPSYYTSRELTDYTVSTLHLSVGATEKPSITTFPSNAHLADTFDFTYEMANIAGYTGIVTIIGDDITGATLGTARIKATHKPTGIVKYFEVEVGKKAIIVLPGIMGSAMYANSGFWYDSTTHFSQNEILWDPPIERDSLEMVIDLTRIGSCVKSLKLDQYPVGVRPPIVNNSKDSYRKYGAKDIYKDVYLRLYEEFSDTHDVILYEYDWRLDPYNAAVEMEVYIANNNYCDIVFVSHSMGGLVSSQYMALGANTRDRVNKHISVGTPYLGAEKLAYVYNTGDALDESLWIFDLDWTFLHEGIKQIVPSMPSIYALLPTENGFTPYLEIKNLLGEVTLINDYSSTIDALSTYLSNWNDSLYYSAQLNHERLFINGKHVTKLVDSYYIVGDDESTPQTIQMNLILGELTPCLVSIGSTSANGDRTVPLRSALINGAVTDNMLVKYSSDVVDADHTGLIRGKDNGKTFDYICDVIRGVDVNSYNDAEFFGKYSGFKEVQ